MRFKLRLGAIVGTAALIAAVPALAAKPPHPSHPAHPSHPSHPAYPVMPSGPSKSHKCAVHKVAFVASGTLVSWSATANTDGTYSGKIVVDVTRTNHHAAGSTGDQTITLGETKVRFGTHATPPAAGDRVKLIGKVTAVAKKCSNQSAAGTITIRQAIVKTSK
jgi:hypothetical protein